MPLELHASEPSSSARCPVGRWNRQTFGGWVGGGGCGVGLVGVGCFAVRCYLPAIYYACLLPAIPKQADRCDCCLVPAYTLPDIMPAPPPCSDWWWEGQGSYLGGPQPPCPACLQLLPFAPLPGVGTGLEEPVPPAIPCHHTCECHATTWRNVACCPHALLPLPVFFYPLYSVPEWEPASGRKVGE